MSRDQLFGEFSAVDPKAWKQKIQVDLKGADYNDTLVWESPEGIKVRPFYTVEDLPDPGIATMERETVWRVGQRISADDPSEAHDKCLEVLAKGVDDLVLNISKSNVSADKLLKDLISPNRNLYVNLNTMPLHEAGTWLQSITGDRAGLYVLIDPVGHLAASGNWHQNREKDMTTLQELVRLNGFSGLLGVDVSLYQNAGAQRVQQLAYAMAHAAEYLKALDLTEGQCVTFSVSVDGNYFFEIAKLRALRHLWNRLTSEFKIDLRCRILCFPTRRNKTLYDYNVNMLRTTTECMSAILGGADTVYNLPYDVVYHEDNEFAERIARNQLLILKHESYFDQVGNAAAGAYYIESLTAELIKKSWDLYQQIEKGGGLLTQLKEHKIQKKIRTSAEKEQKAFDNGEEVLVGTNKYSNNDDRMKEFLQKDPFMAKGKRKTLIEPIVPKRLAEELEKNRLDHEQ